MPPGGARCWPWPTAGDSRNALFPFTDVIYALTPLRFLGQRYQLEWYLENRECPERIRALLEPREHVEPAVVSHMVDYYVRAGAMPALAMKPDAP
jgi:hypothetical protein